MDGTSTAGMLVGRLEFVVVKWEGFGAECRGGGGQPRYF